MAFEGEMPTAPLVVGAIVTAPICDSRCGHVGRVSRHKGRDSAWHHARRQEDRRSEQETLEHRVVRLILLAAIVAIGVVCGG